MAGVDAIATLREGSLPAEALARVESGRVGWNAAEILRVSGEQIRKDRGSEAARSAEAAYPSLARHCAPTGRTLMGITHGGESRPSVAKISIARGGPRELLADVHGRFTEGFQTADYAWAGALLLELSEAR